MDVCPEDCPDCKAINRIVGYIAVAAVLIALAVFL